jgi:colicin import membrane protein
MNEPSSARNYFFAQTGSAMQAFLPSIIISFVAHMVVFGLLFYTPGSFFKKKITPTTLNVNLVSLPNFLPEPTAGETKAPDLPKKTTPAKKKENAPVPVKPNPAKIETHPQPIQEKTSLKKKTYQPASVVKKAIKDMERKVEANPLDSVAKALENIKKNIDQTRPEKDPADSGDTGGNDAKKSSRPIGVEGGNKGSGGSVSLDKMELYLLQVKEIFHSNWAFSEQMAGNYANLQSIVVCTILPYGNIGDVWFEKRSGNAHLDDSAFKAILKSGPLPPLPPGYNQPYTAGYVFTPSGVQ